MLDLRGSGTYREYEPHTVAYFFHDERIEEDLVHTLIQTVGLIDLLHLLVQHHLFGVRQLWTQYPVVEFL